MLVRDIRAQLIELYRNQKFMTIGNNKTGAQTVEIINACFLADEPTIFGSLNEEWAKRELQWYESMSLNVDDIPGGPPQIWSQVASSKREINSNYGWCIYGFQNGMQYQNVLTELDRDSTSRRAVMIYTRPSMHVDFNRDGMQDFICTNTVQYFIREEALVTKVDMRSNDAVFGYNNDFHWQKHVRDQLLGDLRYTYPNLQEGPIFWNAGSLHVYSRHFKYLEIT